jgi:hypothetical protein
VLAERILLTPATPPGELEQEVDVGVGDPGAAEAKT